MIFKFETKKSFFLHHLHPLWCSPPPAKASHHRKSHVRSTPSAAMPSTIRSVAKSGSFFVSIFALIVTPVSSSFVDSFVLRCIVKPKSESGNPYNSTPVGQKPNHSRDFAAGVVLFFLLTQAWVFCLGRDSHLVSSSLSTVDVGRYHWCVMCLSTHFLTTLVVSLFLFVVDYLLLSLLHLHRQHGLHCRLWTPFAWCTTLALRLGTIPLFIVATVIVLLPSQ
ncbi:hypothetical protein V8G54_008602, partial [Vigna mungo]